MTREIPNLSLIEQEFSERVSPVQCDSCGWTAIEKVNGDLLFYPPVYLHTFEINMTNHTTIPACNYCLENKKI